MKILRGMRIRRLVANILTQIILCIMAIIFLIPFIWMFLASFMTPPTDCCLSPKMDTTAVDIRKLSQWIHFRTIFNLFYQYIYRGFLVYRGDDIN